ncbi:hypothetical protein LCGC14_2677040, partial [marine sediment metagenome]
YEKDAKKPEAVEGSEEQFQRWLWENGNLSRRIIGMTAEALDTPLILGIDRRHFKADHLQNFNSAVFVAADGKLLGHYDKMHLVLFGEYVPFAEYLPWLQHLTPLPTGLTAGREAAVFELGELRIAPNICYETVLPHVIRRQVKSLQEKGSDPDVLVNLTNDG